MEVLLGLAFIIALSAGTAALTATALVTRLTREVKWLRDDLIKQEKQHCDLREQLWNLDQELERRGVVFREIG